MNARAALGIGVAAFAACTSAHAILRCDLDGQPVNPANGATTAGRSGLMRCVDADTGAPQREQELRNGVFMGVVRFFRDGQVEKEYRVNERGNRDGLYREWAIDKGARVLVREETASNGNTVGVSKSWSTKGALRRLTASGDDGREVAAVEFNDGGQVSDLRCGPRPAFGKDFDDRAACGFAGPVTTVFHANDGRPAARVAFDRGVRTKIEQLGDDGTLRRFRETTADGALEREYAADGAPRRERRWVALDGGTRERPRLALVQDVEFHASGKRVHERRFAPTEKGEAVAETWWYLNGQVRDSVVFAVNGNVRTRTETRFNDDGSRAFEGAWRVADRGDRETGTHRSFDAQGRLRAERVYDDAGRLTRERDYDAGGAVVRDDEVFEDGSRKATAR